MAYQGWANYPTWAMALWIDNDQGLQEMTFEQAVSSEDVYVFADTLKEFWEDRAEERGLLQAYGPFADIFGWALEQVDWDELARYYFDGARENG